MKYKKILTKIFIALAVPLVLFACGGGGGGGGVTPTATATKFAMLNGAQETPAVTTGAVGTGTLTVDTSTGKVTGSITVRGLTATLAHVHDGAPGVAGGIVVGLAETSPGSGVWQVPANAVALTADQIAKFTAGNLYFNAHTVANPGGEIRGQITLTTAPMAFSATLNGAQETPPVTTAASGTGRLVVDPVSGKASGSITITGLTATLAHVHDGAPGVAGGIVVGLQDLGGGVWIVPTNAAAFTADQIAKFTAGNLYFNAHTVANPGGEIRGQINLPF
jgi:hypothetical protein